MFPNKNNRGFGTSQNQSALGANRLKLVILGVLTAFIFVAVIISGLSGGGDKSANTGTPLQLDTYDSASFSISKPTSYKVESTNGIATFSAQSESDSSAFSVQKYSTRGAGLTTNSLKESEGTKAGGQKISGIEFQVKKISEAEALIVDYDKATDGQASKKAYVFGNSNIWLISFAGNKNSDLLRGSDKIIDSFGLKRSDSIEQSLSGEEI